MRGGGYRGVTAPNFRGETPYPDTKTSGVSLSNPLPADTVSFKANEETVATKEKKGLSKGAKWGIGIGTVALTGVGLFFALRKNLKNVTKIEEFFDKNIKLSNLPEKIEYKEAKTVDEAIEFTKKTFGIKHIIGKKQDITLDAMNYINEGLTNVANANKGKIFIPTFIDFDRKMSENTLAGIYLLPQCYHFGTLSINPSFFNKEKLAKNIIFDLKMVSPRNFPVKYNTSPKYNELFNKAKSDINSLTTSELRYIFDVQQEFFQKGVSIEKSDTTAALKIFKTELENANIKFDIDEINKIKDKKLRFEKVSNILKEYQDKTGKTLTCNIDVSPHETLYHEIGHAMDLAKNYKTYIKEFTETRQDHFVSIFNSDMMKLFKENPEKFKLKYPKAFEFLTNQDVQSTANSLRFYSATGIGDFIADVYAKMIAGEKLSDDVLALYKKYNGPLPVGYK
ncbi:hypothetical protein IJO12_05860 [bacterium]|nr:hypothetical protein [bacterium]